MKKLLLIGAAALMVACGTKTDGYKVTVNVNQTEEAKLANDTLTIAKPSKTGEVMATAVVENGKAVFVGKVETPEYYYVYVKGVRRPVAQIFMENAEFTINYDVASKEAAVITGGGITQEFLNKLEQKTKEVWKENKLDSLMQAYRNATEDERAKIVEIYEAATKKLKDMEQEFIDANPVSHYSLHKLSEKIADIDLSEAEAKIAEFEANLEFKGNAILEKCKEIVAKLKPIQIGQPAIDFTQNNEKGEPVKFSDIYSKNKVTMLDCWASWCNPCRKFNPTLVEIYKKYHKKGFEILGVSFDQDGEAWKNGIKEDKLTWPQVSDLGGWNNAVGGLYYIRFIPQNVFVDQNGTIIARRLENKEQIEELLEKYLK
jgi:thiol-disulfide isomerase/thioredoxin